MPTSPDAVKWTRRTTEGVALGVLAAGSGTLLATGDGGTILRSVDGLVWTQRTSGTADDLLGAGAVGQDGTAVRRACPGAVLPLTGTRTGAGNGTSVTLRAVPGAASAFGGWGGALAVDLTWTSGSADLHLYLLQESPAGYDIRAASDGTGPTESISHQAAPGRYSVGVSSAFSDSACTLTVTGTATGPATVRTLAVKPAGGGAGTVTSSPAGISCGTSCWTRFATTRGVTLAAAATAGSRFAGRGAPAAGPAAARSRCRPIGR